VRYDDLGRFPEKFDSVGTGRLEGQPLSFVQNKLGEELEEGGGHLGGVCSRIREERERERERGVVSVLMPGRGATILGAGSPVYASRVLLTRGMWSGYSQSKSMA